MVPKGIALQPILTPSTDNANPIAAKKQPARAAGPQKRSRIALSKSHWFQYACPNFPWTAAVAPMPKKNINVLLAKMDDAWRQPASLGRLVYRVKSGCWGKERVSHCDFCFPRTFTEEVSFYIDKKSRRHAQTAIDTIEHGPAQSTTVNSSCRSECVHADAASVVDAPGKCAQASQRAEYRLSLRRPKLISTSAMGEVGRTMMEKPTANRYLILVGCTT